MVKNILHSSTALSLNEEQQVLRQGILDNPAAMDYLLLLHHKNLCFNLSDNSHGISIEIQKLTDLALLKTKGPKAYSVGLHLGCQNSPGLKSCLWGL